LKQRLLGAVRPVVSITLLVLAALVLRHELQAYHWRDVIAHMKGIPTTKLLLALSFAAMGYVALTGYDALALRFVKKPLPYRRIALTSFIAYALGHSLTFFGGSAVRYRMLSAWGLRANDIARVIGFVAVTFWLGFFLLGGVVSTGWPMSLGFPSFGISSRVIGLVFLVIFVGYLTLVALGVGPLRLRNFELWVPGPQTTAAQLLLSIVDWLMASLCLYVLLPKSSQLSFFIFLGSYLLAVLAGLVSYLPGGLGVFETAMVLLLRQYLPGDQILGSIFVYRIIYYLLPMFAAVLLLVAYEARERRRQLGRAATVVRRWLIEVAPRAFAITTFIAGAVLLLSGATPALPERLAWLYRTLPLPVIEISTLLGSLFGALLLILANALRQRIDAAYYATLVMLGAGAVASLLKGLDWEEASLLLGMAAVLLPCRSFFYRRSSLLTQPLSLGWWLAVMAVALGSVLALELGYRHVEYSNELWWRFAAGAEASRSLRATLVAGAALLIFGVARLLRPAPPIPAPPTAEELDRAQAITNQSANIDGYLALLGDKELLFHETGNAFLMFGVSGRTWVGMGDPIGSAPEQSDLAWRFRELADRHAGRAVFYEVSEAALPIYLDLGLALRKLGEEGRVPLRAFSLQGGSKRSLRQTYNRMGREKATFDIVPASGVPSILDELETVSNAWLSDKGLREKGFSLGFFDRAYLLRLPVAVVRKGERIVAFANVWPTESKVELSIDLMRYDAAAPPGVMEFLFTELMLWGKAHGYQYFSLGMAPLSGLEHHRLAPLWNRFGEFLFRHGEHFYNFQGLRAFKQKFDPEWEPRYLAAPRGLSVPFALTRIAALVSGGVMPTSATSRQRAHR
jgi:phosphatidylglycerol lysyltransferase